MLQRGSLLWLELSVGLTCLLVSSWTSVSPGATFSLESYGAFDGPAWVWGLMLAGAGAFVWLAALTSSRDVRASALVLAAVVTWSRAYFFYLGAPWSGAVATNLALGAVAWIGATIHVWRLYDEEHRASKAPPP